MPEYTIKPLTTNAHIVEWLQANNFSDGLHTLSLEEIAYIINNYVVTYGVHAKEGSKACRCRAGKA